MYSSLAPRLGQTPFSTSTVGTAELRGGKINWGSLGSSISNAFRNTGRFIGQAASKFAKSQTFQDIKKGLHDSGLVRNVAGLAGDTLSSLVDIGRVKLDSELQKLRNKALNNIPADQLAQILQNYQQNHDKLTVPEPQAIPLPAPEPVPAAIVEEVDTRKRPYIEEVVEDAELVPEVADVPAVVPVPYKRSRLRGTGEAEWQKQLNNMLGQGVRYTTSTHCY